MDAAFLNKLSSCFSFADGMIIRAFTLTRARVLTSTAAIVTGNALPYSGLLVIQGYSSATGAPAEASLVRWLSHSEATSAVGFRAPGRSIHLAPTPESWSEGKLAPHNSPFLWRRRYIART